MRSTSSGTQAGRVRAAPGGLDTRAPAFSAGCACPAGMEWTATRPPGNGRARQFQALPAGLDRACPAAHGAGRATTGPDSVWRNAATSRTSASVKRMAMWWPAACPGGASSECPTAAGGDCA